MPSFQVLVLGFSVCFLSPFPDSLPTSVPQVLPLCFRFRAFPFRSVSFRPLLFRFLLLSLCFFLSSFFPLSPHSGFFGAPLPLSLLRFSPFFPTWFPVPSFPVLRTRLSVCFLSSFPASLPQLFHRCFPSAFAFASGLFPRFRFLSSASLGSDYSASVSSFPLSSRFPLTVVSSVLLFCFRFLGFPRSFRPSFPCLLSRFFVLSFLHFLSPSLSRLTVATSAPLPSSFRLPASSPLLSL